MCLCSYYSKWRLFSREIIGLSVSHAHSWPKDHVWRHPASRRYHSVILPVRKRESWKTAEAYKQGIDGAETDRIGLVWDTLSSNGSPNYLVLKGPDRTSGDTESAVSGCWADREVKQTGKTSPQLVLITSPITLSSEGQCCHSLGNRWVISTKLMLFGHSFTMNSYQHFSYYIKGNFKYIAFFFLYYSILTNFL